MEQNIELFGSNDQVWCFQAPEPLNDKSLDKVKRALQTFISSWESHGSPVEARFTIFHQQIIVVNSPANCDVSGCSKDSLYEAISKLLFKTGLNFLDRDTILWDQDGFQAAHKDKFRQLVESGEVNANTLVYDTTLNTGTQFEEGQFLKPLGQSWHREVFL